MTESAFAAYPDMTKIKLITTESKMNIEYTWQIVKGQEDIFR